MWIYSESDWIKFQYFGWFTEFLSGFPSVQINIPIFHQALKFGFAVEKWWRFGTFDCDGFSHRCYSWILTVTLARISIIGSKWCCFRRNENKSFNWSRKTICVLILNTFRILPINSLEVNTQLINASIFDLNRLLLSCLFLCLNISNICLCE